MSFFPPPPVPQDPPWSTGTERPRASTVQRRGTWSGAVSDTVVLAFDDRHRRRVTMRGVRGLTFLLDLAETTALHGGDTLRLDDGRFVEIVAMAEPLVEITGATEAVTVRIAWHLGNRHLAVQLVGRRLRIRRDHVIEEMVQGLGGSCRAIEAPFDPEGGAYGGGHNDHDHFQGHDHSHTHEHGHSAS